MPKKLITKHISDLTDEDKVQYLAYLKESFDVNYGLDWDSLVPQIMEKIEFIFSHDDETDPDPASIAARAYFRKYGKQGQSGQRQESSPAPNLADFMIFGAAFQKGIDEVSWWADVNGSTDSTASTASTASTSSTASTDGSTAHVITSQAPVAASSAMDSLAKTSKTSKTSVAKNRDKEGRGKENKGSKGQSLLSPADKDLFYNTYFSLIDYVNRKYGIIRGLNVLEEQDSINPEELNAIASKLWANPKKEIDAYLAANHQEPETEELLQSWKRRIKGRFVIERYLKQGTIFISLTSLTSTSITSITEKNENENEENENEDVGNVGNVGNANNAGKVSNTNNASNANNAGNVYFVKGLSSGYEAMFRNEKLPLMVDATLLPFKNVIITDGLVAPYGLRFIGKLKNAYKEVYLKAKHEGRIHTEL